MAVLEPSELLTSGASGRPLLGFDVGEKTIGLAICDPGWQVASPLTTIQRGKWAQDVILLINIIKERAIGGLVVGLPRNMDGSEGARAQSVRALAKNLLKACDAAGFSMPLVFWDERLSTAAVERFMIEDDMTRKRRGEVIDKAAAAYILQGALDALRAMRERG